jgi:hypothetical protein
VLALDGDGDGEVDVDLGEQADRGSAVPGLPADDLSGVQADGLLAELVILFSQPPLMPVKKKWSLALRAYPEPY